MDIHEYINNGFDMYQRLLQLPQPTKTTFFLWGPRQVGKSSLLKTTFPEAPIIDLLKTDEFTLYNTEPHKLRERAIAAKWKFVIIDEIQKAPKLLDEVHYLIENHAMIFGLCGSSARKVKRGHANLLGGRALRFEMSGLVSRELGTSFDLQHLLATGYMPLIFDSENAMQHLKAYCNDYLKEEIYSEGLVKDLQPFSRFLEIAALGDTEPLSYETVARDCGVSAPTVKSYYEILVDTLLESIQGQHEFVLDNIQYENLLVGLSFSGHVPESGSDNAKKAFVCIV